MERSMTPNINKNFGSALVFPNNRQMNRRNQSLSGISAIATNLLANEPQQLNQPISTSLDLTKTFFLNSLPGANHTIYLDFNGHTTTGTFWNTDYNRPEIVTPAFDLDGVAGFSAFEQERIQQIWQHVAEDFIPFNVNVTTQQPADINDLIRNDATQDTRWGVRVVIGGNSQWYGQTAGGTADINSFNKIYMNAPNIDTPAFVFEDELFHVTEKDTAELISHEVGHALGLDHHGRFKMDRYGRIIIDEEYYQGHGSGETGWAPIMGTGFTRNLTQWSKGEYANADKGPTKKLFQDDLQIITTRNGFSYRVDDVSNDIITAKPLSTSPVSTLSVSGNGIIERTEDVDFYSFITTGGLITLDIQPANRGPNLDILAELYNYDGRIASSNPVDSLSANISVNLSPGTYYLKIDGVGKGDPLTTGYSDYGSLGQYFINGTGNFIPSSVMERWATRQGGFWDAQQWLAGDFNGDGKDDMAKAFTDGGLASIDAHLSNGSSFNIQRWATRQGGFWDAQQWLAGDFNGDGKDDMAKAFNDNGLASMDVHLSNGSSFIPGRWGTYQGSFWDGQQWLAGDFNGDGKDDMAKAFNDNGLASIDVHLSNGSSFTPQRWATYQGGFWDAQQWLVGDFNGDGKDDMAKAFTDEGLASVDVHLSNGSGFNIQRWATRQGGFWDAQQWLAGDFNGIGRDEIGKAFTDNGLASIDVHTFV